MTSTDKRSWQTFKANTRGMLIGPAMFRAYCGMCDDRMVVASREQAHRLDALCAKCETSEARRRSLLRRVATSGYDGPSAPGLAPLSMEGEDEIRKMGRRTAQRVTDDRDPQIKEKWC